MTSLAMLIALAIEGAFGWPDRLFRLVGHPVTWIGRLISWMELRFNLSEEQPSDHIFWGRVTVFITLLVVLVPTIGLTFVLPGGIIGAVLTGILAAPLVAPRSMHDHVANVARPLNRDDIEEARSEVAKIVGRDPSSLDEHAIARAVIESLAENTSDGIVAPVFWGVLLGLPGIAAYKAINTLDSMIGHKSDRYLHFGRAAARLDDVVNWIPARLTALIFSLASGHPVKSLKTVVGDAHHHRSPNAGWPEAAMAGGLNIRLSGPRAYETGPTDDAYVNETAPDPTGKDITRALALYLKSLAGLAALLLLLVIF
ncbi:MAG: cobalamin biosynthesis protein CobD [Boseongicola sp.]|nr:MAG: cobalamin biosynthesis protein CobD [Boseongicola sp.]